MALVATLLVASVVHAGPMDGAHRLERVGPGATEASAILPMPGINRLLMFQRGGEVRLVTGGGLANDIVARVPATAGCGVTGVLAAIWDPGAVGQVAFVTYTNDVNFAFTVGRLDLASGAITEIYRQTVATPCVNLGGGMAFAPDGTLFVGVGDMSQPSRATSPSAMVGKILRMTRDGGLPSAPLATNPLSPGSYLFDMGVRDPVALASDPATGDTWFLDVGPGDEDELNRVAPLLNFGWGTSVQMGYQGIVGLEDPFHVWSPGIAPSDLAAYPGRTLCATCADTFLVSATSGRIESVRPDPADRRGSTGTVLFTRDATGPQSFQALAILSDEFPYLVDETGTIDRFVATGGNSREPSTFDSILPVHARKAGGGGGVEIAVERARGASDYGLFVGNVTTLARAGYSHQLQAATYFPADANVDDAFSRMVATEPQLGGAGASAYFLVSARRDCVESDLGRGTISNRPMPPSTGCTIDVLGRGTHDITNVDVSVILAAADSLVLPRDLAFHPDAPSELWVINLDSSVVILHDRGLPSERTTRHSGAGGEHFFSRPTALAFGPGTGFLATIHEEDDYTQGPPPAGTPIDFMGPTLWTADSSEFEAGHASHYDMLHNSPNGVGIAWESGNAYWVYDGYHRSLTRYDFADDHGPGGADHSDAIIRRYAEGQVGYAPDIGSHVQYDPARRLVYAADTAGNRIVVLDPATGTPGGSISPNYDGCSQTRVDGAAVSTLVDGAAFGLMAPSGLELRDDMLFVSDNATSMIYAFAMDGSLVDYLDTGFPAGSLMGMALDPADGSLYVVDVLTDRVIRIAAR